MQMGGGGGTRQWVGMCCGLHVHVREILTSG